MRLRSITLQFALALAAAALLPLVCFGAWSLTVLNRAARTAAATGNVRMAEVEAAQVGQDGLEAIARVNALATALSAASDRDEQRLLLRSASTDAGPFRQIAVVDAAGRTVVASTDEPLPPLDTTDSRLVEHVFVAPVQFDALGTPWTRLARSLGDATAPKTMVVAIVGLEHMTRLVEQVRAGEHGGAVLLNAHGQSIATGHAVRATDAGRERALTHGLGSVSQRWAIYTNDVGVEQLGAAAPVTPFGWTLLIEQPTDEAFSAAAGFGVQLALAAVAALVLMAAAGTLFGRRLIAPVVTLEHATRSLAEGRFDVRVVPEGTDEVARLARSFNVMADRLSALQDRIKSQERQVMFGRVVAGLFHDLSHPIETIANSARLLLEPSIDLDERRAIGATIERERASLGRFLDDVLNVARPRPLDRVPVDVNACVAEAIDALRAEADKAGVTLAGHFASGTPTIAGDRFALGRVCRNLIANAVQATPPGGHVVLYTTQSDTDVEIEIADTGMGIPPDRLVTVFDDFVTTKKRGLGLGLATSRRIVEQLSGSIRASSEVGRGSTFTLHFPRHVRVAVEAAS